MLTKLIRHEFRATSRIMWPIFAGMLALTLAMRASQNVLQNESPWLLNLLAVLVTIGFVFGIMALCFAPLVLSAVRFRDHLLKDEGCKTNLFDFAIPNRSLFFNKTIIRTQQP